MKIRFLYVLLAALTFSVFTNAQERGLPIIRNYSTKEYKGAPQVFSTIQDNRGVMYFGSGSSILEYDGVSWRSIPNEKQKIYLDFAKDNNGRIYVSATDEIGYLSHNSKGNTYYHSITNLLPDSTKLDFVWTVRVTSKYVYFITYDAILQFLPNDEKFSVFRANANDGFLDGFIYDDIFYAQCEKSGLVKVENNELKHALQSEFFEAKNIFRTALPYDSTSLLVPTRTEGLYLYNSNKDIAPKPFPISDRAFLENNNIFTASLLQNDYFLLGSVNKGAVLLDKRGTILQQYQVNNLQNNTIRSIVQDNNQNIWFGLENGISKTENALDLSYWDKNSGLKGSVYNVVRFNGTVYIATSIKMYFINKSNQVQEVKNIPVGHNWCFMENKLNKSLLAGSRYGIYEIKGDYAERVIEGTHAAKMFQSDKNPNRVFSSVLPDFISLRFEGGKWISEGKWEGIKDQIRGVIEDENGDLWLGTYRNGVIRVTPNYSNITKPLQVKYYIENDGFTSLSDILPFRFKNRIVFASAKGLFVYNSQSDRFEPFCELGEQFCNGSRSVFSLLEMPDGKVWICPKENSKNDIGYLQPNSNGGYDWVYVPFRRILEMQIESFYVEPSGIAWVGGSEGLFRYNMNHDTKNYAERFECLIRTVTVGTDSLLYGGNGENLPASPDTLVSLSYKLNKIKFEFAAPFFDLEEKTLYSFKLNGFDEEWSKFSRETAKEYSNLSEGKYTFMVKARNVYDTESAISTYEFSILPPWYRTVWAYLFYIVLTATFIWLIVWLNSRRLKAANAELEKIVAERTSQIQTQAKELANKNIELEENNHIILEHKEELLAINEELSISNEELDATVQSLKETQRQLVHSEKMASLGVMASGVAHEINNPLNFIQGGIHGLEKYFDENLIEHKVNVEYYMNWIREGIERTETIVSGLNFYSRTVNSYSDRIDIHNVINNCLSMLQHKMQNRIEIIKNFTDKSYTLIGNVDNFHQALFNIISNSIQAIDAKGKIAISTEVDDNSIKIIFVDTGCGISKENLPKILDPFFTTKAPGKGIGLGLSITYNILQEHNGKIEFESEVGKGTTAIVTLPVKG
jgi:signal transduction histidine kinase